MSANIPLRCGDDFCNDDDDDVAHIQSYKAARPHRQARAAKTADVATVSSNASEAKFKVQKRAESHAYGETLVRINEGGGDDDDDDDDGMTTAMLLRWSFAEVHSCSYDCS